MEKQCGHRAPTPQRRALARRRLGGPFSMRQPLTGRTDSHKDETKKGNGGGCCLAAFTYRERCFCQRMLLVSVLYSFFLTLFISRSSFIIIIIPYRVMSVQLHALSKYRTHPSLILRVCPLPLCAVTSPTSTPTHTVQCRSSRSPT
jgi:hypothetical protein